MTLELAEPTDVHLGSCAVWRNDGACDCDAWRKLAACRTADPAIFFPSGSTSPAEALAMCARCPVLPQCRAYVDSVERPDIRYISGVYAGETAPVRVRRRRSQA